MNTLLSTAREQLKDAFARNDLYNVARLADAIARLEAAMDRVARASDKYNQMYYGDRD